MFVFEFPCYTKKYEIGIILTKRRASFQFMECSYQAKQKLTSGRQNAIIIVIRHVNGTITLNVKDTPVYH